MGSHFYRNKKYRLFEIEKKIFFHLIHFRKCCFLIYAFFQSFIYAFFYICVVSSKHFSNFKCGNMWEDRKGADTTLGLGKENEYQKLPLQE